MLILKTCFIPATTINNTTPTPIPIPIHQESILTTRTFTLVITTSKTWKKYRDYWRIHVKYSKARILTTCYFQELKNLCSIRLSSIMPLFMEYTMYYCVATGKRMNIITSMKLVFNPPIILFKSNCSFID